MYNEPNAQERIGELMLKNKVQVSQLTNDFFITAWKCQEEDIKRKEKIASKYLFIDKRTQY